MVAWAMGVLMGLIAFAGLLLASAARDGTATWVGLLLLAFGVLSIFGLIRRNVGAHH
jgi:hypothetical protein